MNQHFPIFVSLLLILRVNTDVATLIYIIFILDTFCIVQLYINPVFDFGAGQSVIESFFSKKHLHNN